MKKNNMLRIASVLLVAVLLSTCAISGAFAKYTASADQYADNATVAKFGITITTTTTGELFVDEEAAAADGEFSVKGAADVVAPGMEGTLTNAITITDAADREVAVIVKTEAVLDLGDNWLDENDDYYCPLTISVGGEELNGMAYGSAAEFAAAVEEKLDDVGTIYYVGDSAAAESIPAITWAWDFVGNDAADTVLGKAANATISLTIDVTVDQVDE